MLRLRKPSGEPMVLDEDFGFLELCDSDGNPVFVFFKDGAVYRMISANDKEAKKYADLFGVRFAEQREIVL